MTTHTAMPNQKVHEGRNLKRFREMLGIKQDALAYELGEDWSQKKISLLEQKETIELPVLQQLSAILKIPVEAFQNFDEEQAVNIISNTFDNGSFLNAGHTPTFNINPIEELRKLHEEKIALYERMLQEKEAMMTSLKELFENMKKS